MIKNIKINKNEKWGVHGKPVYEINFTDTAAFSFIDGQQAYSAKDGYAIVYQKFFDAFWEEGIFFFKPLEIRIKKTILRRIKKNNKWVKQSEKERLRKKKERRELYNLENWLNKICHRWK